MFMHFDMNYNHSRILFLLFNIYYGYVWNPEIARERKKNSAENYFLMFGFTVKNIKENQI